jgi:cation:H+ antiporter
MGLLRPPNIPPAFFLILLLVVPLHQTAPSTIYWAAPAILISALMIAWAAEASQFFMAQGFALAILAWMQTLPEFAVEGVFAWTRQVPLLMANLTGALRLLTGVGWPLIYVTAAFFHRRRSKTPLRSIQLDHHHSVEVIGLLVPLIYIAVIVAKGTLTIVDAIILIAIYSAYLWLLTKLPSEKPESVDELESIPRAIVTAPRAWRITAIAGLFGGGGLLIYIAARPFAESLLSIAAALGIPSFIIVQWVAPLVSEFPELASTTYFARTVERAPMALMNMVSSNINQWTLLVAMLPIVYSVSLGHAELIPLDQQQRLELMMTLGQALLGLIFLLNMSLVWWEAVVLFGLFATPLAFPVAAKPVTGVYFAWAGIELMRIVRSGHVPAAIEQFAETWRTSVSRRIEPRS